MEQPDRIPAAIGLRLLSTLFLSVMGALVKLAEARGARLGEVLFFRQMLTVPLLLAVAAAGPGVASLKTARIGAHLGRAVIGLSAMTCLFFMLHLLPLAEATSLQFSVPIFATVLGALVLRETIGWRRWSAVVAGFVGVLIVARPSGGDLPLAGAVAGLGYGSLTAIVSILLRSIGRTEPPLTTVFWFATLSMPPLLIFYALQAQGHPALVWGMLIAIGLCGAGGQLALTASLRLGPVSVVVPMDYASLLWATGLGWLAFDVLPDRATWFGAPLIIGSGLIIVWREHQRHRQDVDRLID